MQNTARQPKITVFGDGGGIVSHGGALLLAEAARVTGLHAGLSHALQRWRLPRFLPAFLALSVFLAFYAHYLPELEETITRAELRDEAWAGRDWTAETDVFGPVPDVHVPASGFERDSRAVVVVGQDRQVPVTLHHSCEALRFTHVSMVVTAVARLGFPRRAAVRARDRPEAIPCRASALHPQLATVLGDLTPECLCAA